MKPPVFPLAPAQYDQKYMDQLLRILTQYLNQESVDELVVEQRTEINEVLVWLS